MVPAHVCVAPMTCEPSCFSWRMCGSHAESTATLEQQLQLCVETPRRSKEGADRGGINQSLCPREKVDMTEQGGESLGETGEATDTSQEWVGLEVRWGQERQTIKKQGRDESCQ